MPPIFQTSTNAELAAWRDDDAELRDIEPTDPAEHSCMYHEPMTVPVDTQIITRWDMVGAACRPCAESIVAYLHGARLDNVNRKTVITAAKLSVGMAKTLGQYDEPATVTELRPQDDPECE
jgi:hypothetical protein